MISSRLVLLYCLALVSSLAFANAADNGERKDIPQITTGSSKIGYIGDKLTIQFYLTVKSRSKPNRFNMSLFAPRDYIDSGDWYDRPNNENLEISKIKVGHWKATLRYPVPRYAPNGRYVFRISVQNEANQTSVKLHELVRFQFRLKGQPRSSVPILHSLKLEREDSQLKVTVTMDCEAPPQYFKVIFSNREAKEPPWLAEYIAHFGRNPVIDYEQIGEKAWKITRKLQIKDLPNWFAYGHIHVEAISEGGLISNALYYQ